MNETSGLSLHGNELPVRLAFTRPGAAELYAGPGNALPAPATPYSAGIDLRACLDGPEARIPAGGRLAVPTGLSVQPAVPGWAGFVYSRAPRPRAWASSTRTIRARFASSS